MKKEKLSYFSRFYRYSIRKTTLGVGSICVGVFLAGAVPHGVSADVVKSAIVAENPVPTSVNESQGNLETSLTENSTDILNSEDNTESVPSQSSVEDFPSSEVDVTSEIPLSDQNHYELNYTKPASTTYWGWEREALPIGNGDVGAKVFGLVGEEKIQFNEKTLWSGGPETDDTTYNGGNLKGRYQVIPEIRKALEEGEVAKAKKLAETQLVGPYSEQYGRYLSFGDVTVDITNQSKDLADTSNYKRALDLKTAIASTDYIQNGTVFHRESFVSYPDNVSVTHFTKMGNQSLDMVIKLNMSRDLQDGSYTNYSTEKSNYKEGEVNYFEDGALLQGHVKNNGLQFASSLRVDTDGSVDFAKNYIKVIGANYVTLYLSAETNFAQDPKTNYRNHDLNVADFVRQTTAKAREKGFKLVKQSHLSDYQKFFNRVTFNITNQETNQPTDQLLKHYDKDNGQELEELFYQYGRYLLITSSRDGQNALPANLQGVWNAVDNPPWNSDYHLNVNLQMNYWPVYSANLAEMAKPLINYVDDMRYYGRVSAEEYANIKSNSGEENGWMVHTQATPFGWTTPGWSYYWGWAPTSNAWIMQNVYDYYKFTKDEQLLTDKIYPMLKETAKFWNSFLHYDKLSDRYVSSPSYSPEHGTITIGNTYDQSLIWQLFHDFIEAANHLGVDGELVNEVSLKIEKLDPLHINKKGQIKEWYEEDTPGFVSEAQPGHRHVSHLVGLFPGTLFSKDNPDFIEAAKATLNDRGDGGTGWSKANKINLWARLLDGNRAHALLSEQLRGSTLPNLWDTHTPFQIDGNFGATSGMTEMLLQSHNGYIALLPALPDAWKTGQVTGLMARGNVQVDMDWVDKNLITAHLTSNKGGAIQVDYPSIETATVQINGKLSPFKILQPNRVEVQTKPGDIVEFTNIMPRITNVTVERLDDHRVSIAFPAFESAIKYDIKRETLDDYDKVLDTAIMVSTEPSYIDNEAPNVHRYRYSILAQTHTLRNTYSDPVFLDAYRNEFDDRDDRILYGSAFHDWSDSDLFGGTEKYAEIKGESDVDLDAVTATIPFYGTGIEIYGIKSKQLGKAYAFIDGKPVSDLDFYKNGPTEKKVLIAHYDNLEAGNHVLTIRINSKTPTRTGERRKISLDYFRVIEEGQTLGSHIEQIDDRDSRIVYGPAFNGWNDASLYKGTETYADVTGKKLSSEDRTATLTFEGTAIEIYGLKTNALGKAKVYIDGIEKEPLNFYHSSATAQKGALIGRYDNLSDGSHTISIEVSDEALNEGRNKISLDFIKIYKATSSTDSQEEPSNISAEKLSLINQLKELVEANVTTPIIPEYEAAFKQLLEDASYLASYPEVSIEELRITIKTITDILPHVKATSSTDSQEEPSNISAEKLSLINQLKELVEANVTTPIIPEYEADFKQLLEDASYLVSYPEVSIEELRITIKTITDILPRVKATPPTNQVVDTISTDEGISDVSKLEEDNDSKAISEDTNLDADNSESTKLSTKDSKHLDEESSSSLNGFEASSLHPSLAKQAEIDNMTLVKTIGNRKASMGLKSKYENGENVLPATGDSANFTITGLGLSLIGLVGVGRKKRGN